MNNGRYGWGCAERAPWVLAWVGAGCVSFGAAAIPGITIAYGTHTLCLVADE